MLPSNSGNGVRNDNNNIDDSSWDILTRIFENDYWGHNMNELSSHKFYRPITVLFFRYGRGIGRALGWSDLYTHRILNIVLHGALVQMVGILGVRHVEIVMNAANRAYLLGLVLSVWELDVSLNVVVLGLVHLMALLSCETVVFMFPAVVLTLIWMVVASDGSDDDEDEPMKKLSFIGATTLLLPPPSVIGSGPQNLPPPNLSPFCHNLRLVLLSELTGMVLDTRGTLSV